MTTTREVRPDQHGTHTGYSYGCRCIDCSSAAARYQRKWRNSNPGYRSTPNDYSLAAALGALVTEADLDGLAIASYVRIGELAGLSPRTAGIAIHLLHERGRVEILDRDSSRGGTLRIQLQEADL